MNNYAIDNMGMSTLKWGVSCGKERLAAGENQRWIKKQNWPQISQIANKR
jgi:hypothetical protein